MVEKASYYNIKNTLTRDEHLALKAFNGEVRYHALITDFPHARIMAIGNLNESIVTDLAKAFGALYPHWFTNGRGTAVDRGRPSECQRVCLEVVGKLNKASGREFADILRLFDLSGDHAMPTGRRPLAHTDKSQQGGKRTRTRIRNAYCKYHPEKPTQVGEWCTTCYGRMLILSKKGIHIEDWPGLVVEAIMRHPRTSKKKPLHEVAREINKKYKEIEESYENSTSPQ